jgi:hypothetical protein
MRDRLKCSPRSPCAARTLVPAETAEAEEMRAISNRLTEEVPQLDTPPARFNVTVYCHNVAQRKPTVKV